MEVEDRHLGMEGRRAIRCIGSPCGSSDFVQARRLEGATGHALASASNHETIAVVLETFSSHSPRRKSA